MSTAGGPTEQEFKHVQQELQSTQERLRLVLEGIREYAIFTLNPSGAISTWNPGAQRLLGFSETEAIGQTLALIIPPEADEGNRPGSEFIPPIQGDSLTEDRWFARKDGNRFWGSGTLSSLQDSTGELTGYLVILRDNTDKKTAEEVLRQTKQAADSANEARDQFLSNISHELRTPLSAIVLWASLIEDQKTHDPEQLDEAIRAIRKSAEEQRELMERLVDNARIMAGKLRLEPRLIDLAAVVRDGVETVRALAGEKKVTLEQTSEPGIDSVMADGARIKQVVSHLVDNAIKFTPSGGRVHLKLRRLGEEVEISISDTGVGMSKEVVAKAFDRFNPVQLPGKRNHSGRGVGLAISRQIIEQHGGTIRVDSPGPGEGCTFTIRLPTPAVHSEELPQVREPQSPLGGLLTGRSILLIEDGAATRRALSAVLNEAGARVDAVDSAPAAWEAYERQRPDAIISDLGLPTIDGYAFLRQIRESESELKVGPTPAVALTAFAGDSVKNRALQSGFQACVTKPVEPHALVMRLVQLLNGDRAPAGT